MKTSLTRPLLLLWLLRGKHHKYYDRNNVHPLQEKKKSNNLEIQESNIVGFCHSFHLIIHRYPKVRKSLERRNMPKF